MKVFLSLALLVTVALAEPPQYRQQQQQQRYYFARQQEEPSAPYPARGWKPDGPAFNLPERQQQQQLPAQQQYNPPAQPQQQYGPPAQPQKQYGPPAQPQQQYGPPAQPQQQYGPPAQPQQQYGAPAQPAKQQQFAPIRQPQVSIFKPQFGRQQAQPQQTQNQYGPPAAPQQPQNQYGPPAAPQQQYGPPQSQYGAPEYDESTTPANTEFDDATSVIGLPESEPESTSSANELDDDADIDGPQPEVREKQEPRQQDQQQKRGEYYVALPDGRLQRVQYVSREDVEAMRYFAKIQAENVEPLRGPIYAYAPLQKLEVTPGALQVAVAEPQPAVGNGLTVTATEKKPERLTAASQSLDIKPIAQLQIQHDSPPPQTVVPLSSSYATFTADYRLPVVAEPAQANDRYILALP